MVGSSAPFHVLVGMALRHASRHCRVVREYIGLILAFVLVWNMNEI
jgi:hypothetical protein